MKKNEKWTIVTVVKLALVAALYVVLTYALSFIAYGDIQFRIAEILMLLCFINKRYALSLIVGCAIANIGSPYGIYDIVFGTLATAIACLGLIKIKNIWLASLAVPIANIITGIEIGLMNGLPFIGTILTVLSIIVSELIVVTIIGVPIIKLIMRNKQLKELIENV